MVRWTILLNLIFLIMGTGCGKDKADLLVYNGKIYSVNDDFEIAEAMVIRSGRIEAIGKTIDLKKQYLAAEELDLQGKSVFPGFIDPHCHFASYGLTLAKADLTGAKSPGEVIGILKKHRASSAMWLLGRGWDQNDWTEKKFPDKEILDRAFPDIPVYLVRIDGHAAWVNSKALELAGIHTGKVLTGGEIRQNVNGPTGILLDNAMTLVEKMIPVPSVKDKTSAMLRAQANCFSVGLTMVGDAGLEKDEVLLMDSLQKADRLKMRIYAMLSPSEDNLAYFVEHEPYRTEKLTVCSIKLYADGALGSRGALLLKPYADDPGNKGLQLTPAEMLNRICSLAFQKGYQVNTHCIGDSAVRMILNLYKRYLPEGNDLRWRIEHAQVLDTGDFSTFGTYGVVPSIQATHATSDMYWASARLGPERILHAYAYKSLLKQNGWLANGSDFPVESINPVYGFYAAVSRKDLQGFPPGGFQKEEALNRNEALKAMTIWAARACREDKNTGSLEAGKVADFVVLDRDVMDVPEEDIPLARVLKTYLGGEKVYESGE